MSGYVVEISDHGTHGQVSHVRVNSLPVTVGRGYGNDIIVADPYVAAAHLRISPQEGGYILEDLGSENGTLVNGTLAGKKPRALALGDRIRLGRTELRLLDAGVAVEPALRLQKTSRLFAWANSRRIAWLLFVGTLGFTGLLAYFFMWDDQPALTTSLTVAGVTIMIFIWSAIWTVAGRLSHHRASFHQHVALASAYMTVSALFSFVTGALHFLTSGNAFSAAISVGGNLLIFAALIYGGLTFAADMTRRKRLLATFYFVAGISIGIGGMAYVSAQEFEENAPYDVVLEPYLAPLVSAAPLEDFMADSAKLFESKSFDEDAEEYIEN
jgi:hypothetical protein